VKLAWLTDIHFDHLKNLDACRGFLETVYDAEPEAVVITGDISMAEYQGAPFLKMHLTVIADSFTCPVYFVLGNHDYYGGSIEHTREKVQELSEKASNLHYLTTSDPIELTPNTTILGHDGWYDMRLGQIDPIRFLMTDWELIKEYEHCVKRRGELLWTSKILEVSRELADGGVLKIACDLAKTRDRDVLVLTHVPPFEATAKYKGQPSELIALPVFVCKAMGDMLLDEAANYERNITVLTGHTHDPVDVQIAENLRVKVGAAQYGKPRFEILEIL
jgi:Icc protein